MIGRKVFLNLAGGDAVLDRQLTLCVATPAAILPKADVYVPAEKVLVYMEHMVSLCPAL